jgi:hypothetical protein
MAFFTSPEAPFRFAGAAFVVSAVTSLGALLLLRSLPRAQPV